MRTYSSLIPITREWLEHPDTQVQFYILFGISAIVLASYIVLKIIKKYGEIN